MVTGGEALYADMGHFGRRPIRLAWFTVVLPALLLNYFGQGALLLGDPSLAANPFYHLAPSWALYPLVALATAAAVIASQAVISGALSLTWQAVQLGLLPRVRVIHTSEDEIGQIYIPGSIGRCWWRRSRWSSDSGHRATWRPRMESPSRGPWSSPRSSRSRSCADSGGGAYPWGQRSGVLPSDRRGVPRLEPRQGGRWRWFPLLVAAGGVLFMTTWRTGRRMLVERLREQATSLEELKQRVEAAQPARVPGTVIYMTGHPDLIPAALRRLLRMFNALHEHVVFLTVLAERVPRVRAGHRLQVQPLG